MCSERVVIFFSSEEAMENVTKPMARQNGLVVQDMPGETLVYDTQTNKAHCLNESAAAIWRNCDGTQTIEEIVENFNKVSGGQVSDDFVWLAIDQLNENGLIEGEISKRFEGSSRRQALKTIGTASLVALPVIASLVAPQNALASLSCVCTSPGGCITQTSCASTVNCNPDGICAP